MTIAATLTQVPVRVDESKCIAEKGCTVCVDVIDQRRSHWVARGTLGVHVEWDAEIINDIPPTLLSWKSTGHSDVVSAGSVRFKPAGEHATQVHVKLQYDPPAGKLAEGKRHLVSSCGSSVK